MRPALLRGADEALDEIVIVRPAHPLVTPPDIDWIGEALGIVGSDVQENRQGGRGVQAGTRSIQRQFSDRNPHAARTLVAETENAFAIADDDGLDPVKARVGQNVPNAV